MAYLSTKIEEYMGRSVDFTKEVILVDEADGNGPTIQEWNITEKSKPTDTELADVEAAANIVETNRSQVTKREIEYGTIPEQLEYIVENGIDAFITKQKAVKTKYPKE